MVTEKAAGVIDLHHRKVSGTERADCDPVELSGAYGFAFTSSGYLILSEAAAGTLSSL